MSTFSYDADYGITKRMKPAVQNVQFGDGYSARYANGLNTQLEAWDVRFSARDETEANAIDDFFAAAGGVDPFVWTAPGASDSINVICQEWTKSQDTPGRFTIQATFQEVADP